MVLFNLFSQENKTCTAIWLIVILVVVIIILVIVVIISIIMAIWTARSSDTSKMINKAKYPETVSDQELKQSRELQFIAIEI